MNEFNFIMADAIATLVIAYMAGWAAGLILWLIRYLMVEVPKAGKMKGGDF
jgi:hypothetical protein